MAGHLPEQGARSYAFGPFVLIPGRQMLRRDDAPVRIGGRALDILTALVERPGDVIGKSELLARVWPDTFVDESNLKVNMAALRRALGDGRDAPRYVATVIGRGYRFVAPVRVSDAPLPQADPGPTPARRHNLPNGITRVFGRETAIGAIHGDLEKSRIVSIVGPGGIGKTTVALAVAEQAMAQFADGVWWVELAPLKDARLAPSAIAAAIGLTAQSTDISTALCDFLRDRDLLIVLDSCEHVVDAAAACVDRILRTTAGVRFLVTSREPLRVKGERVRRLPGLDAPPDPRGFDAEAALAFPAVQLFVERATDRLETFRLSDADAPAVAEICSKLDGLALAIELAATRVDAFGVEGVLAQLDDRFRLLVGRRAGAPRHRTLSATIDWSFDLLSDDERIVMRRLSVFAGAFTLDAACAVAANPRMSRADVIDALANLVSKSLIAAEAGDYDVAYRQFDTTRSYALEKLVASGELDAARRRHAEHCLDLAAQAEAASEQRPRREWLDRYGAKIDDFRDALRWAAEDPSRTELAVTLCAAAIPFWKRLSLLEESRTAIERALGALARIEGADASLKLSLVIGLAEARTYLPGDPGGAVALFESAVGLARETDDPATECRALGALATYKLMRGEESILETLSAMRDAAARAGHPSAMWEAEQIQAQWEIRIYDFAAAHLRLERLADEMRGVAEHGAPRFQVDQRLNVKVQLGAVTWLVGRPGQARRIAREVARDAEAADHGLTLIHCLAYGVIWTLLQCRDIAELRRCVEGFADAITRHAMPSWIPVARCYDVVLAAYSDDPPDPRRLRAAFDDLRAGMAQIGHSARYTILAQAMLEIGQATDAARVLEHIFAASPQPWGLPELLRLRAATELAAGRPRDAEATLREAVRVAEDLNCLAWTLRAARDLAALLMEQGLRGDARRILSPVYARFADGFDTGDLGDARALLERIGA